MADHVQKHRVQDQPLHPRLDHEARQRGIGQRRIQPAAIPGLQAGDAMEQRPVEHAGGVKLVVLPDRRFRRGQRGKVRHRRGEVGPALRLEQHPVAAQDLHLRARLADLVGLHRQRRRAVIETDPVPRAHLFQPRRRSAQQGRRGFRHQFQADRQRQHRQRRQRLVHVRDMGGVEHMVRDERIAPGVEIAFGHKGFRALRHDAVQQREGRGLGGGGAESRLQNCGLHAQELLHQPEMRRQGITRHRQISPGRGHRRGRHRPRRGLCRRCRDRHFNPGHREARRDIPRQHLDHICGQAHIRQSVVDEPRAVLYRGRRQVRQHQPATLEQRRHIDMPPRNPQPPQRRQHLPQPRFPPRIQRQHQRIAALQRVLGKAGQVGRRPDLQEQPHAVRIKPLHRFGEPDARGPLARRHLPDFGGVLGHRRRRHAGIDRQGGRLELHPAIDRLDLGRDIREKRRVIGPVERQKGAHAALPAQTLDHRLHLGAAAVKHRLMLAIVQRKVDVRIGLYQRQDLVPRHAAHGQQRPALDPARGFDRLIQLVQRPDARGKLRPVRRRAGLAQHPRRRQCRVFTAGMADHRIGADPHALGDGQQRLRRDEHRLGPQFQPEQPL